MVSPRASQADCGLTADNSGLDAANTAALKPSEALTKAADLIEPEGAWTTGVFARDAGRPKGYNDPAATCWCAYGALMRVMGATPPIEPARFLRKVITLRVDHWNDNPRRSQPQVVAALRQAAALAKATGQ